MDRERELGRGREVKDGYEEMNRNSIKKRKKKMRLKTKRSKRTKRRRMRRKRKEEERARGGRNEARDLLADGQRSIALRREQADMVAQLHELYAEAHQGPDLGISA